MKRKEGNIHNFLNYIAFISSQRIAGNLEGELFSKSVRVEIFAEKIFSDCMFINTYVYVVAISQAIIFADDLILCSL